MRLLVWLLCSALAAVFLQTSAAAAEREFRGVWVATVHNIDWPSKPGLPASAQKAELRALLDRAAELKLTAILLQLRPASDALYASSIEPWSQFLSGKQGTSPGYDPLEFAIAEAHARGIELHAWINPFRASSIEPWSQFLSGKQGTSPGYDPLEFAIAEAHDRRIELHAWINPFRAA
ncbi:MAG: family 10 glycosylhydrolase, partial [Verrucomicrobiota bacterium]|nr:family 10 glycosylhydrolase [Verrucomicrobiota bacterium]